MSIAEKVKAAGASFIRGGAYKPRTSPYSFQGLGEEGLPVPCRGEQENRAPVVTEIMDQRSGANTSIYRDIIQIGARNMQNFRLLLEVGMQ